MAEDDNKPNQSNKPVNGKIPKHIQEALEQRDYLTSYEHLSTKDQYRGGEEKLAALELEKNKVASSSPKYQKILENIAYAEQDLGDIDKIYHDKQNEQLANTIATYTKTRNINQRTTTQSSRQRFYKQTKDSEQIYQPTETLEANIQKGVEQVNQLGTEIAGRMRGLGIEEVPESLKTKAGQIGKIEEEIAFNKRLIKVQNRQGLSTEKMYGRTEEVMGRTADYFEKKGVEARVAGGDVRSIGEETKELGMKQRDVFVAQEQYDKALEDGAEDVSSFVKALKNATDALDKQQKVVGEMGRQGVGGGPPELDMGDIGKIVAMGGRAVAHGARGIRTMMVDQQREEMQHKTAFAAMGNRIYNKAEDAIMGGDIDAMLELTGGSMDFAKRESAFAKTTTNVTEGIAQVGDAAVGVGNTMQATKEGLEAVGYVGALTGAGTAMALAPGISQGAMELTNVAVRAGDLARGNVGARQAVPTREVSMGLSQQMRAMDAKMLQTVYDQGMTTYNSVSGLGSAGDIQKQLMSTDTLGKLTGVGLTPEKAAQLTAGMRAAGAMTAGDAMQVVTGAGAAKQRGILGQEEYVGMAAQLMGAGGGAGDLEGIMAAAVAAGMDNSKSIGELVSGTLALSQNMAGMGVSGTGATQNMLAAASQNLIKAGVDPNLAAGAALQSLQNYSNMQSDTGFNLGNIMERSGLRQINSNFTNANVAQIDQLQKMTAGEHKILMQGARATGDSEADKKARADADQLLKSKGLTEILNPNGEGIDENVVKRMSALSAGGVLVNQGAMGQSGVNIQAIVEKASKGEKLTDKETAVLANAGVRAESFGSAVKMDDPATSDANKKGKLLGATQEETQAKFKHKELTDAEKKAGGSAEDIFKSLEVTMAGIQESVGPEKIGKVVEDAAKNFEAPVLEFKTSTGDFKTAVDKFVQWQNTKMKNIGENEAKPKVEGPIKDQKDTTKRKINPRHGF